MNPPPPNEKPPSMEAYMEAFRARMEALGVASLHGLDLLRAVKMVAHAYEHVQADLLRAEEISFPRWRVLLWLWMAEQCGHPGLSPTQLSHTQHVSKNTISAHLRSLEEQGYVDRQVDPEDLRQFRIHLTDRGRALVERLAPRQMERLNHLVDDLSPEETRQLRLLLEKLHRSIRRRTMGRQP